MPDSDTRTAAHAWHAAHCTIIPIRADGSKAPAIEKWRQWITDGQRDPAIMAPLFHPGLGIAVLCGTASADPNGRPLEMLEIEGPPEQAVTILATLDAAAAAAGIADLWARIRGGYVEASPKGGVHFLYRVDGPVAGNTKLARRPARPDELTEPEQRHLTNRPGHVFGRTVMETRGQGGYVIVAPSPATCSDPKGPRAPWTTLVGRPDTIPVITGEELLELHRLAAVADTMPVGDPPTPTSNTPAAPRPAGADERPGDRYAAETSWEQLLQPAGWTRLYEHGGKTYWARPGKTTGVSATTSVDGLWVFSTSTTFLTETLYTKFGAYAHLHHGDDFAAAARELGGAVEATPPSILRPTPGLQSAAPGPPQQPPPALHADPVAQAATHQLAAAPPRPPSWRPVDPTMFLAGNYTPPAPQLMPRTDGQALLYRGMTHSFIGESESGKSLVVQAECARILTTTPEYVLYIDYEDTAAAVFGRMLDFGVPRDVLAQRFHYVHPEVNPYAAMEVESFQYLLNSRYALIAIDGVTDALLQEPGNTGNGDPNRIATAWARRILDPLAATGAAVVTIDHVAKSADGRGRFAIGASAKMNVITGAVYLVEPSGRTPLGPGLVGELTIRVAKDRPGGVRPHGGPRRPGDRTQEVARVVVDSTAASRRIIVSINKQATGDVHASGEEHDDRSTRQTAIMEEISRYVIMMRAASGAQIRREVKGKTELVLDAIRSLVAGGYLQQTEQSGRGGGYRYTLLRPFDEGTCSQPVPVQVSEQVATSELQNADEQPVEGAQDAPVTPDSPNLFPVPEPVPSVSGNRFHTPSEPVPPGGPLGGPLEGTGSGGGTGEDQKQEQEQPRPASTPIPVVAFKAPAAPAATAPPTAGRLTRPRHGDTVCERCNEVVDAQLVAQGYTTHYGCD